MWPEYNAPNMGQFLVVSRFFSRENMVGGGALSILLNVLKCETKAQQHKPIHNANTCSDCEQCKPFYR